MSKDCEKYQDRLIDIFYEELEMDEDIKNHLESCTECNKYWKDLQVTKLELDSIDVEFPIEYIKINEAFNKSKEINNRRNNIKSLILFIFISSIILSIVTFFAIQGYTLQILYAQIAMICIIPIFLPIMIKIRSLKEGYNE